MILSNIVDQTLKLTLLKNIFFQAISSSNFAENFSP
jgi:hypothetical protein